MNSTSKKTIHNILYVIFGRVGGLILSMIMIVSLARYFGEETFGVFSFALVFIGFFSLLPNFGMKPILVRELSRNSALAPELIGQSVILKLFLSVLAIILANAMGWLLFPSEELRNAIFILSFIIFVSSKMSTIRIALESIFHANLKMEYPTIFLLLDSFLQTAAVLILISLKATPSLIMIGYVTANIPGLIVTMIWYLKSYRLNFTIRKERLFWLIKESLPLLIYITITMLYDRYDVLLLKHLWGEASVGIYSTAFRLTSPLIFIPFAVVTGFYPLMSRARSNDNPKLTDIFNVGIKSLAFLGMAIGALGILMGEPIFLLLYGSKFSLGIPSFLLLLNSQSLIFIIFYFVDYNNSQNRQKSNMIFMLIMVVLAGLINYSLISQHYINGAGWAKLITSAIGLIIMILLSFKHLSSRQVRSLWTIFGILAVYYFLSGLLVWLKVSFGIKTAALSGLFILLWFCLFTKNEKIKIKEAVRTSFKKSL